MSNEQVNEPSGDGVVRAAPGARLAADGRTLAQLAIGPTGAGTVPTLGIIAAGAARKFQPDIRHIPTFDAIAHQLNAHRVPAMTRLADVVATHLTAAGRMQAAGAVPQLNSIVTMFAPQRAAFDAIDAGHLAQSTMFRDQMRQILSAQTSISRLAESIGHAPVLASLLDTVARYGQVQNHLGSFTIRPDVTAQLLRGYTITAGRRYDSYLDGLPSRPISRRTAVAQHAGDTQTGLLVAESLTAPDLDPEDGEQLADHFTVAVLEPWQTGPADVRTDLLAVLADIDPVLVDLLKGAWDDVSRNGPAAASKVAHCSVELIDRALRTVTSDDDVLAWLAAGPQRPGMLTDRGRPTRTARVTFFLQHRSKRDRKLAVSQIAAVAALVNDTAGALQPVKHADPVSITLARNYLLTTESALMMIFGEV